MTWAPGPDVDGPEADDSGDVLDIEDWGSGVPVARVVLDRARRRVRLVVWEEGRRRELTELFDGRPLGRFTAGFRTPDGMCGDAVERVDLWDARAVRCLHETLYPMGLRLVRPKPAGGAGPAGTLPGERPGAPES